MNTLKLNWTTLLFTCTLLLGILPCLAQNDFPGKTWKQFTNVEDAGFSASKLEQVKKHFGSSKAASLLVIKDGKVLISWGNNTRKFMVHSIRKSFLNALYGIYVDKGVIDLNSTLKSLGIDDIGKLTETEREAKIRNLLSARSGVYHPSAYSTRGMIKNLPARGSHAPGTYWYYNNWDFNTLATIFEQQTGKKIFSEFQKSIAKKIKMQDFQLNDGYYRTELDISTHPAYLFRMSARDMARFGLLYLNQGRWKKKQLISKEWVTTSTSPITKDLGSFNNKGSFGYLWWISDGVNGEAMYYASGAGGHRISILPESDIVFVQRINTYEGKNVSEEEVLELIGMLLNARNGTAVDHPLLSDYNPNVIELESDFTLDDKTISTYLGTYRHKFLGNMTIKKGKDGLVLESGIGIFKLYAKSTNSFIPEDIMTPMIFKPATGEEKKLTIESVFGKERSLKEVVFYY